MWNSHLLITTPNPLYLFSNLPTNFFTLTSPLYI